MSATFPGAVPLPKPQTIPLTILITGGGRGLGCVLVQQYANAHKDNVILAAVRNPNTARHLSDFAALHANVHIVPMDVADEDSVRASVASVSKVTDHLDLLINNAVIIGAADALTVNREMFNDVLNTNVAGVLSTIQAYLPYLRRSTSSPKVINISAAGGSNVFANRAGPTWFSYGVSKAALNYLTSCIRLQVPDVTFLALHPGWVNTEGGASTGGVPPTAPSDSVQALRYYIAEKGKEHSGEFIDVCTGEIVPY
jgi:NAD(P)-dependent dehydrogenase (short-subunit alcohol dehydrogenase family)